MTNNIKFLVASPYGDLPVDDDKLDFPLEGDPLKTTYRSYFQSIRNFLGQEDVVSLFKTAGKGEIKEIVIRTEKHGALSHPASIELILKEEKVKFGLNVAVTDTGRDWLREEFSVLKNLQEKYNLPYLPNAYLFDNLSSISFLLEEWFEGYHEFHIAIDEEGRKRLKLWEFGAGYKYLSYEQSFEIYKQASKILTLYYDMNDFCQIYPWHHAAGDFVVRIHENISPSPNPSRQGRGNKSDVSRQGKGHSALIPSPLAAMARRGESKGEGYFQDKIDVRLTTARQYDPYMVFQEKEHINPVIALFYFLLNLTIKMRLDKLDGVGDTVWAEDFCLEAAMKGFIEGLRLKDELKDYLSSEDEFLHLLKSFRLEDLKTAYSPLIDLYKETGDYPVITVNLDRHVEALYTILQNSPS